MSRSVEWRYLLGSLELEAGIRATPLEAEGARDESLTREEVLALALSMGRSAGRSLEDSGREEAARERAQTDEGPPGHRDPG